MTPFASERNRDDIATEIDLFNEVNKYETEQKGIQYVDITPYSRQALSDPSLIADDGLHPSGKMYASWVVLVLPKVIAIFAEMK